MKAITISQPFATLIANGDKFVENRTWPPGFTGKLAIHAGLGTQYLDPIKLASYPTGQVIAICDLVGCLHRATIFAAAEKGEGVDEFSAADIKQLADHEHTEGPYCWILRNIVKLKNPVLYRGRQRLWEFDETHLTD